MMTMANCMAALVNILASAVGSLTNPTKLANTFGSNGMNVSDKTIGVYIGYLSDAFIISKAERYDIKGKKYIASPFKYYFTDVGLRNAQLNFRQQEENHIMENIIIGDSFKKIIVVKDRIKLWRNEEGIAVMGIMDFLLNPSSLDL